MWFAPRLALGLSLGLRLAVLAIALPSVQIPPARPLARLAYLDSPTWSSEDGSLYFSDVQNGRIHRLADPSFKETEIYGTPIHIVRNAGRATGLEFDLMGRLVVCEVDTRKVVRLDRNGNVTVLAYKFENKRFNSPEDLTIDSRGRIYFTDPRYGSRSGMDMSIEGVYRIDVDDFSGRHRVSQILNNKQVRKPNGIALSPDEKVLYVIDSQRASYRVLAFALQNDGTLLGDPRVIYDFGDGIGGNGICVDANGTLYVAAGKNNPGTYPSVMGENQASDVPAGIYIISSAGERLGFIPLPEDMVTNCGFGGWDLRTLFITAGAGVYTFRSSTPGLRWGYIPQDEPKELPWSNVLHPGQAQFHSSPGKPNAPKPRDGTKQRAEEEAQLRMSSARQGRVHNQEL